MYEPLQVKKIDMDEGTVRLEFTLSRGDQIRMLKGDRFHAITVDDFRPGVGGRVVLMFPDGDKIYCRGEFESEDEDGADVTVDGDTVNVWRDKEA